MDWIKCVDRFPEEFEDVLFTDGKDVFKGHLYNSGLDDFILWFSVSESTIDNVTHWMLLPNPPKD